MAICSEPMAALEGVIPNIAGSELQRVELPADSPRGGVLTMGSVLTVTYCKDAGHVDRPALAQTLAPALEWLGRGYKAPAP